MTGWLLRLVGLAVCTTACQFSAVGSGEAGDAGSGSTTGTTGPTTGATTTMTTAVTATESGSATTDPATTTGDATTGETTPGLVDEGLLARYFIDESQTEIEREGIVHDAAPTPLDLDILHEGGQPYRWGDVGRIGVAYDASGAGGRVASPIEDTKVHQRLDGARALTLEAVVDVEAADGAGSRIIHIGEPMTQNTELGLAIDMGGLIELRWNGEIHAGSFADAGVLGTGRRVLHLVVDLDREPTAQLYVDGTQSAATGASGPGGDETLALLPISVLVLFNRTEGQRSFQGVGHYAALYDLALSPQQVAANAQALLASDDG